MSEIEMALRGVALEEGVIREIMTRVTPRDEGRPVLRVVGEIVVKLLAEMNTMRRQTVLDQANLSQLEKELEQARSDVRAIAEILARAEKEVHA